MGRYKRKVNPNSEEKNQPVKAKKKKTASETKVSQKGVFKGHVLLSQSYSKFTKFIFLENVKSALVKTVSSPSDILKRKVIRLNYRVISLVFDSKSQLNKQLADLERSANTQLTSVRDQLSRYQTEAAEKKELLNCVPSGRNESDGKYNSDFYSSVSTTLPSVPWS